MDQSALDQGLARAWEHHAAGRREAALAAWGALRAAYARDPAGLAHLGAALLKARELPLALEALRAAATLRRSPGVLRLLGQAFLESGQFAPADEALRAAAALAPESVETWVALADAALTQGRAGEAAIALERALKIAPEHAVALHNLASIHTTAGRCGAAMALFERLAKVQPERAETHNNMGVLLMACGRTEDALAEYRRAVTLQPDLFPAYSNLLHTLHYSDAVSLEELFAEHLRWAAAFEPRFAARRKPWRNNRAAERQLRIGYLSPDLRGHPVAMFLEPILASHDPKQFHVTCYHDSPASDATTARLKGHAARWRDVRGVTDERLAELIRSDQIDILIDLAAHAQDNRMAVFAMKPAPVQITYIAYASTTGLAAMDYRLTDTVLDPPGGGSETWHTEKLLRLPEIFWCYRPPEEAPDIGGLPAMETGEGSTGEERAGRDAGITFGSANRLAKLTKRTLEAWSRILAGVPHSRLLLIHTEWREPMAREHLAALLAAAQIPADRVEMCEPAGMGGYLATLRRIDIGLDSYPFNGGATTCNMLWMGVPVVTLAGRHPISRVGATIMHALGLPDWVTTTTDQYVRRAIDATADRPALAGLRQGLRERMRNSPLTRGKRFTRHLEEAYREAWRTWCAGTP